MVNGSSDFFAYWLFAQSVIFSFQYMFALGHPLGGSDTTETPAIEVLSINLTSVINENLEFLISLVIFIGQQHANRKPQGKS